MEGAVTSNTEVYVLTVLNTGKMSISLAEKEAKAKHTSFDNQLKVALTLNC